MELFELGIHVFVKVSIYWKWLVNPYANIGYQEDFGILSDLSKSFIQAIFFAGCITFNEEAIKSISSQLKTSGYSNGEWIWIVRAGIAKWCKTHSASPEEAENKYRMMVGEKAPPGWFDI